MLVDFVGEKRIPIRENESILQASLNAGIQHFHACGGNGKCSTCRVLVVEGTQWLSAPNETENSLREQLHFPKDVRLACQTSVTGGPVRLKRIIRDEADIGLYTGSNAAECTQHLGEEKDLTLLFLDIRDFTPFVETHLAFDVIHIIRKLFTVFNKRIEKNGGRIVETTGDGLYAVFGYENEGVESRQKAVHAAYGMLADLDRLNETYFRSNFGETIEVGIGIHAGNAVSGAIQIGPTRRFVVMGYPVNVAARLQNATKDLNNNLVVSAEVYNHLHKPPALSPVSIHVKGVTAPLAVYLLGKPYPSHNRHPLVAPQLIPA